VTFLSASWGTLSGSAYAWIYLLQGERFDGISGQYYCDEREDSSTLGHWLTADPSGLNGGDDNLYRFVENTPLIDTDPMGLGDKPPWWWGIFDGGHGAPFSQLGGYSAVLPAPDTTPATSRNGSVKTRCGTIEWDIKAAESSATAKITFAPDRKNCGCTIITFIQVIRSQVGGIDTFTGKPEDAPYYEGFLSEYHTRVDHVKGEDDPYYGAKWDGSQWVSEGDGTQIGNARTGIDAKLVDFPKAQKTARTGKGKAVKSFETAVFCIDSQEVLADLNWGFSVADKRDSPVTLLPVDVFREPSAPFRAAVKVANGNPAMKHKVTKPTGNLCGAGPAISAL
jgi:RHS repeat-associated protein